MSITIKLDTFEGPLDLLLHLIEKNKMSIYDIQIAPITKQYMEYIEQIDEMKKIPLESMSEFIVMAATLLYIKSKMLLPKPPKEDDDEEEDPRQELVMRLLEYKKMKYISEELKEREKEAEKIFFRNSMIQSDDYIPPAIPIDDVLDGITLTQIYEVFEDIIKRKNLTSHNKVTMDNRILQRDSYTVKEKSRYILDLIELHDTITFYSVFDCYTTKIEMIVTFMAILELVHKRKIKIYQEKALANIWISGVNNDD